MPVPGVDSIAEKGREESGLNSDASVVPLRSRKNGKEVATRAKTQTAATLHSASRTCQASQGGGVEGLESTCSCWLSW